MLLGQLDLFLYSFLLVNWFIYIKRIQKNTGLLPNYLKAAFPIKSVSVFAYRDLTDILIAATSRTIVQRSIAQSIELLNHSFQFKINGVQVQEKNNYLRMKILFMDSGHHSHPTNRILVEATDKIIHLKLILGRLDQTQKNIGRLFQIIILRQKMMRRAHCIIRLQLILNVKQN